MNHSFQVSGDTGVLSLTGALSIENGAELKTAISEALEAAENIVFDLAGVASADICCMQLFCAAHRTAVQSGKTLALANAGEGFEASAREAGYGRHVGCMGGNSRDCLWIVNAEEKTEVAP
jgi:anti-anti-sigma factor